MRIMKPADQSKRLNGPRKDLFKALYDAEQQSDRQDDGTDPISSGTISLHSSSTPSFQGERSYDITIKQKITQPIKVSTDSAEHDLTSTHRFFVKESPWRLEDSEIHSIYPPQGHTDYSNVLPHVLLNKETLPWSMQPKDGSSSPWLALLTFTEEELRNTDAQMATFTNGISPAPDPAITRTTTLATSITIGQLAALRTAGSIQSTIWDDQSEVSETPVKALFLPLHLVKGLFDTLRGDDLSLQRYDKMAHVRTVK